MYLYPSIHTTEPNRDVSPSTCPVMHSFGSRNWVLPSLNTLSQLCSIVFLHIRMGLSKNVHKKPSVWTVSVGRTRELLTDTAQREVHFPGCSFSPGSRLDHTLMSRAFCRLTLSSSGMLALPSAISMALVKKSTMNSIGVSETAENTRQTNCTQAYTA